MHILRLSKSDKIQSSSVVRKLRVKIMQNAGIIKLSQSNLHYEIPESLEDILDFLLSSLSDKVFPFLHLLMKDTIVRYTAAKAVSRIVLHLPRSFSNEIILMLFQEMDEGLIKGDN